MIFYCFLKIVTSRTAKSRRVGKRNVRFGFSGQKWKMIILNICVCQKKFLLRSVIIDKQSFLWINLHLENSRPSPTRWFWKSFYSQSGCGGWIIVFYGTSSKLIKLCWVSQSIKAERNWNGVKDCVRERWQHIDSTDTVKRG